jgi:neutral ceramidase
MKRYAFVSLLLLALPACGDDDGGGSPDAGGPPSTDHCEYLPQEPIAGAGGTVQSGAITAGAAEAPLGLPVGSTQGAYFDRGTNQGDRVDSRRWEWSGKFQPSVGIETEPMARAVAITAGGETVLFVKADLGVGSDTLAWDLGERLGAEYRGKVMLAVSHTHSGPAHYPANSIMGVAFGRYRRAQYDALLDRLESVSRAALDARVPARIGFFVDTAFDPGNQITRDRRGENDAIMGGPRKDDYLLMVRVDTAQGEPLAAIPLFGMHGTILGGDNPMLSTDAPGGVERELEELFDAPVVVMHLQGTGGDVSPAGSGGVDCGGQEYCQAFARSESTGRAAAPVLYAAWQAAGENMIDTTEIEALSQWIELGPHPETFTIRGGALRYAQFDDTTVADRQVYDDQGNVLSPIDEFNAPYGAALCGTTDTNALFVEGQMPGTDCVDEFDVCAQEDWRGYMSCVQLEEAAPTLSTLLGVDFEPAPVCASTRTMVSAVRIGEYVIVTLPGEPTIMLSDRMRAASPVAADKTVILGYTNGEIGYVMAVEDWLLAGYEPSINVWGPLEGEYIAEKAMALAQKATTPEREDGAIGAASRWVAPATTNDSDVPAVDPAPMAGTVPATVPAEVYVRGKAPLASAQPAAQVPRLTSAYFVWIGEDPLAGTPVVTLQRETAPGSGQYADLKRKSGRPIIDGDLLRTWTPLPLRRMPGEHATHYWAVEWQAVTWTGIVDAVASGDLVFRAAVPLGKYRFHVVGTGYSVDSQPFEVVAGAVHVGATKAGVSVMLDLGYDGAGGWRLLDLVAPSNKVVPMRLGKVQVVLKDAGGGTIATFNDVIVETNGTASVSAGAQIGDVATVTVTDEFGNVGSASVN